MTYMAVHFQLKRTRFHLYEFSTISDRRSRSNVVGNFAWQTVETFYNYFPNVIPDQAMHRHLYGIIYFKVKKNSLTNERINLLQ